MWKTTAVLFLLAVGASHFFNFRSAIEVPDIPETHWGPDNLKDAPKEIRPFKIDVSQSVINDLNNRLDNVRTLVKPLENTAWTYGMSSDYLKTIIQYWRKKYNWTERQTLLNKYPQFKTYIQGLDIHFYHVKPSNLPKNRKIRVLPLMMVHGWPGSTVEFQKIIPMLTTPRPDKDFVFELIIPSLPGYGFSDGAVRPGLAPAQIAQIFKNLMDRLGFQKFYLQGGDWGALVVATLSVLYPERVIGVHSNMCATTSMSNNFWRVIGSFVPSLVVSAEYRDRMYPLSTHLSYLLEESGYMHLQASKPDTIGTALSDTPAGLAAYILEKFSTWTNPEYKLQPDGALLKKYSLDELLDNVMMYWITNSITTSVRLYSEAFQKKYMSLRIDEIPIAVPSACALFPHELMYTPESLLRTRYVNMIQMSHPPRGGHFAAMEEPALLADDVFSFVEKVEQQQKEESAQEAKSTKKEKQRSEV